MQCDGCYYRDKYENVCNHGSPIFDIEDNCTDYIEDDFVKQIRADERAKVIDEIISHSYESKSGFLTVRKGFLEQLKEQSND